MIKERNAVGIDAGGFTDLSHHEDFRLFVVFRPAKNHLLFGRKFVPGEEAGAVEAEEDGLRLFGKNLARQIGADQDDGNLFGDASASPHNLLWQDGGQNQTARGTNFVPKASA